MPCAIWPGAICWRSSPIATCATVTASAALTPEVRRDGGVRLAAGVGDRRPRTAPASARRAMSIGPGCSITAAATSSNTPASSSSTLPPPDSSAGVPISTTVSPSSSATSASASAVPTAEAAMMLCPQACPIPGSASYSAQIPITSGPAAEVGAERGVQPAGRRADLEAALGHQRLGLGAAAVLVERQFRFGVNGVRQLDQVAATSRRPRPRRGSTRWRWASRKYLIDGRLRLAPGCDRSGDAGAAAPQRVDRRAHRRADATTSPWSSARAGLPRPRRWAHPPPIVPMAELPGFTPPSALGHGGQVLSVPIGDPTACWCCSAGSTPTRATTCAHVVHPVRTGVRGGRRGRRADQRRGRPARRSTRSASRC